MATRALRACSRNITHTSDDEALLDQRPLQRDDGAKKKIRAVVDGLYAHTLRQARSDLLEALLQMLNHRKRVHAEALQGDARDDLSFSIQFGDAAKRKTPARPETSVRSASPWSADKSLGPQRPAALVRDIRCRRSPARRRGQGSPASPTRKTFRPTSDEALDQGCSSCSLKLCRAARKLLSASIRKVAAVTISSPGFSPSAIST